MAKTLGPVCKLCRREGEKLYLKGERCFTPKCSVEKRTFPPGQHGKTGSRGSRRGGGTGESDFARQLRAKQKARRVYGVFERQFHRYYEMAVGRRNVRGCRLSVFLAPPPALTVLPGVPEESGGPVFAQFTLLDSPTWRSWQTHPNQETAR